MSKKEEDDMDLLDKYLGSIIGLAVGDALGTTLEFKPKGSFEHIDDMKGGGPFNLNAGEWTDDTSMMLCIAASLIAKKDYDANDTVTRYIKWWKEGYMASNGRCFDIGIATRESLQKYLTDGSSPYCGSDDPKKSGNGSLMRLCPIPLFFHPNAEEAMDKAADSSKTTHGSDQCLDACRYFAGLIIGILNGESKETILSPCYTPIADYWEKHPMTPEIKAVAEGSFKEKTEETISGKGWVVATLEAVLWAFHTTDNFKAGLLQVVNIGDDTDTTGAIYGQIAGAFYGHKQIPAEWAKKIAMEPLINQIAAAILKLSKNSDRQSVPDFDFIQQYDASHAKRVADKANSNSNSTKIPGDIRAGKKKKCIIM